MNDNDNDNGIEEMDIDDSSGDDDKEFAQRQGQ
jgi:hypothetical protein